MFSKFAIYFDEVARSGSIRRASERLHIAPSAIDRQILRMEEKIGMPLFERVPQGLRLSAAGELLIAGIRRWRREFKNIEAQLEDLRGFHTGSVTIALVEGAIELLSTHMTSFSAIYGGISFDMHVAGAKGVVDLILNGDAEVGLTFNPPDIQSLRLERAMIFKVGAVVRPDHPFAQRPFVTLRECLQYPLVVPDESISLREVLESAWKRVTGNVPRAVAVASSIELMKALVMQGIGVGFLTQIDVLNETGQQTLVFVPITGTDIPSSVLTLVTASGRTLSSPASMLVQHLAKAMPLMEKSDIHVV